ncbi:MAG: ABC transporter permease [Cyclobacteriaceae bacterium]
MDKIKLIIAREYLSRVRKKSFIIMSLIGPLLFAGLVFVPMWLAMRDTEDQETVRVVDESGYFDDVLKDDKSINFEMSKKSIEEERAALKKGKRLSILHIPKLDIERKADVSLYAYNNPSLSLKGSLEYKIRKEIEKIKLDNSGIEQEQLDRLKAQVSVSTYNESKKGDKGEAVKSSSEASMAVGYMSAFLIYMFIFIYGAQTMRGIIEEKTSKVIEVLVSTVKPFQLMMGKILGISAVGLTQFMLWAALSTAIISIGSPLLLKDASKEQLEQIQAEQPVSVKAPAQNNKAANMFNAVMSVDFALVIGCFLFYFLGGYLLYGSLFAAVGSAVDSDADSQQFMLPITIPLILSIVLLGPILKDPHGSLAFWTSIIPFTSPVVMMMRIPFGAPVWEIALSMVLLVGGFIFTTWLASRIYRIGIFMHGTKVNYKILAKWFMMKI